MNKINLDLLELMERLHELKHKGKLPKELNEFRDVIECYNPEKEKGLII